MGHVREQIKEIKRFNPRGHGGSRLGAGRKPKVKSLRCSACGDAKAAVLAGAALGCRPPAFVMAAMALGVPVDEIRAALGMSASQFASLYLAQEIGR
jgi:hypothetical protein